MRRPARPDPRRGDLGARRRDARSPVRDRRRGSASEGVGVIFITHRMDEISEIGDRITVMRSGETVATLERGELDAARARPPDDRRPTSSPSTPARRPTPRRAARRAVLLSVTRAAAAAGPRAVRRRDPRRRARRRRRARGPRAGRVPRRAPRARARRRGEVVRHDDGRDVVDPLDARRRRSSGIAYVPRERRQALFALDVDPRELRHADARAATARCGWLRPRVDAPAARASTSPSSGSCSATPDDRDHDAERRQPAEGRDRALARGRAAGAAAQRPDARHRRRRQARPLRAAHAARRGGPRGRDALDASSTSTSS